MTLCYHGLMVSLARLVVLERKHLSGDQLLVLLILLFLRHNFSEISGNSEQKSILQTIEQLIQLSYLSL